MKLVTVLLLAGAVGFIQGMHLYFSLNHRTKLYAFSNICFAKCRPLYFYTGLPVSGESKLRKVALVV